MRINKMLPLYLLEADGKAIMRETGEVIEPINRTEYRLETAEKVFLEIKNKTINLVRRFTREQLIKLYKEGEQVSEVSEKAEKTPCPKKVDTANEPLNRDSVTKVDKVGQDLQKNDELGQKQDGTRFLSGDGTKRLHGLYINGTRYDNLRQAADVLSMSKSTIDRRVKSDHYPSYFKIE